MESELMHVSSGPTPRPPQSHRVLLYTYSVQGPVHALLMHLRTSHRANSQGSSLSVSCLPRMSNETVQEEMDQQVRGWESDSSGGVPLRGDSGLGPHISLVGGASSETPRHQVQLSSPCNRCRPTQDIHHPQLQPMGKLRPQRSGFCPGGHHPTDPRSTGRCPAAQHGGTTTCLLSPGGTEP